MSISVALQSVAFYVLSCSTCAKINHRRKAKVQAKRERAEKHALETEQPGLYRHPSPFSTNPYWTEEIMMGPGPPKQKGESKNASQRALNTAGQGSSYAGSTAMSSEPPSSPTNVTENSRISGDGWNRKRYQREDEALWGHDIPGPGQRIMDAIARAGSSAGRLLEGRLSRSGPGREEEGPSHYYLAKNPPVNDLHPPVVSTAPSSREETRWMLQPPPAAKIMEGKERVNRSRASSNGSSRRGGEEIPLSRQVTERLVDARLQRGETPYSEGRPVSSKNNPRTLAPLSGPGMEHSRDRSRSPSMDSSGSSDAGMRRKRKPPPISISMSSKSSRDAVEHIPIPASIEMREQSVRPMLSTIISSSAAVPQLPIEDDGALQPTTNSAINSRASSPSRRLSPNANAMPVSIPKMEAKFPGNSDYKFHRSTSMENAEPTA
ncbi:uncharacterized protein LY89DRAFT_665972 [Mollisia scopiformis]|uniref:Signal peptide-containing protein n=1 Tax=Mollisia scopiformis TaxID=149040 RepID=A0A194XKG0_MOLSC|nr:uncharacterized protein LY89DRAFT_665972 [Mollisia scopiformis]KUJ20277.1 hypothetical protein LY89DRAFT_665972 [Mollisia scopiformis]